MAWDVGGMRINLQWGWENEFDATMTGLMRLDEGVRLWPAGDQNREGRIAEGFRDIQYIQHHNPPVYNGYQECFNADRETFFWLVVTASSQAANLADCRINIDWQWDNNRNSIKNAQNAYTDNRGFGRARGMYYLMEGQRHNPPVMNGYRAAFRDVPDQLWAYVNGKV